MKQYCIFFSLFMFINILVLNTNISFASLKDNDITWTIINNNDNNKDNIISLLDALNWDYIEDSFWASNATNNPIPSIDSWNTITKDWCGKSAFLDLLDISNNYDYMLLMVKKYPSEPIYKQFYIYLSNTGLWYNEYYYFNILPGYSSQNFIGYKMECKKAYNSNIVPRTSDLFWFYNDNGIKKEWSNLGWNNSLASVIKFIPNFYNNISSFNGNSYYVYNKSRSVLAWRIGDVKGINQGQFSYELEQYNGNSFILLQSDDVYTNDFTYAFHLNNNYLYYYQCYRIRFTTYGLEPSVYYYIYFIPYDSSNNTISSGDSFYTGNDNNNISQQQQSQENNDFWRSTYNSLFVLDSGDTEQIYTMVAAYFPSGDTPLTIYDTIFGSLNNEPTDFVITWEDIPLNITWFGGETLYSGDFIKAGSMNFSKTFRDNETLSLLLFWLHTILTVLILLGYYSLLYQCLISILGTDNLDPYQDDAYKRHKIGFIQGGRK